MVALHLPVQPDRPAGDFGPLRLHRSGAPGRSADRRPVLRRGDGAARPRGPTRPRTRRPTGARSCRDRDGLPAGARRPIWQRRELQGHREQRHAGYRRDRQRDRHAELCRRYRGEAGQPDHGIGQYGPRPQRHLRDARDDDPQRAEAARQLLARRDRVRLRRPQDGDRRLLQPRRSGLDLLSGGRRADQGADRRRTGADLRPHAALGQPGDARGEKGARAGHPGPQRLHRMVGPAARPRPAAGRGGGIAGTAFRHRPGVARDHAGRSNPIRSPSPTPGASRPKTSSPRSGATPTGWARPTRSPTARITGGTISRA